MELRRILDQDFALLAPGEVHGAGKRVIKAGGPGSGCHGENCGRHGGGKGTDKTHLPKSATIPGFKNKFNQSVRLVQKYGWKKTSENARDVKFKHSSVRGVLNVDKSSGDFQHTFGGSVSHDGDHNELKEHMLTLHEGK